MKPLYRLIIVLLLCSHTLTAHAVSEYRVKAALMYNLIRMVEWPGESVTNRDESLKICFIGQEPFGDTLDVISSKKVRNRGLEFRKNISLGQAEQCHVLFISASENQRLNQILQNLEGLPILTISDVAGFAARGVMINFIRDVKKVRIEFNVAAAERAQLNINPALKKLTTVVEDRFVRLR